MSLLFVLCVLFPATVTADGDGFSGGSVDEESDAVAVADTVQSMCFSRFRHIRESRHVSSLINRFILVCEAVGNDFKAELEELFKSGSAEQKEPHK